MELSSPSRRGSRSHLTLGGMDLPNAVPAAPSTPPGSSRLLRHAASSSFLGSSRTGSGARHSTGSILNLQRSSSKMWSNARAESKELKAIRELLDELQSRDEDARCGALQTLGRMVFQPSMAHLVVSHCGAIVRRLQDGAVTVRSAALRTLRNMVEHGDIGVVALHCREIVALLKDEEVVLRSKAAALCRVIAEEGGATLLARHVPELLACFEKSSLVTPLDALRAIVDAGEVRVVSHGISRIAKALENPSSTVRIGACDALAAIGREGGGELLRRLRFIELADKMTGNDDCRPLMESLVAMVHADTDHAARLAAVRALQCIVEADEESAVILREKHSYLLVKVRCWSSTRRDAALCDALDAILGSREEAQEAQEAKSEESDSEDEDAEDCVICQRSLHKHGDRRTLPCHHVFHKHCVNQWFAWSRKCWGMETCPLCRRQGPGGRRATK